MNNLLINEKNSGTIHGSTNRAERWAKLHQRLSNLKPGYRYVIIVTVGKDPDWTVQEVGKVER